MNLKKIHRILKSCLIALNFDPTTLIEIAVYILSKSKRYSTIMYWVEVKEIIKISLGKMSETRTA